MRLAHEVGEEPVAGLQIHLISHALSVFVGLGVVDRAPGEESAPFMHYFAKVGVNVVIVLRVVLVIGGRHENGIEVDRFNPQLIQIIELVHDPLQVAAVVLARVVWRGRTVPVVDMVDHTAVICILSCQNIV